MNTIKVPGEIIDEFLQNETDIKPFSNFIFDEFNLEVKKWTFIKGYPIDVSFTVWFNNNIRNDLEAGEYKPIIFFTIYENNRMHGSYGYLVDAFDSPNGKLLEYNHQSHDISKIDDSIKPIVEGALTTIMVCLSYIMNYPRDRKQTRVSSHKYSREYRLSTKQNRIYLFSDILKYVSDTYVPEGQHHSIQCPCWEVRGHYRHYKSGKVVFIPAYKKGKQRDMAEPKPKEYYC